MTVNIDLPPDVEETVRKHAAKNGQEISAFVLQVVMREVLDSRNDVSESTVEGPSESSHQHLVKGFLSGVGSVVEVFPATDRFDDWRLVQDTPLNEWPTVVRGLVAALQEDDSKQEDPV